MTAVGEGLAANLASEASKDLFNFAKRHVGYCFHFRKHVADFMEELEKLEFTRNDALERERSAWDNNEEITEVAKNWLGKAKDLIDAAEKVKKKTEEPGKCVIGWCPDCIHRYGLGKKAAMITPELNRHNTDFNSDNFSRPALRLGMEFHAPINFIDLESRKMIYDQLWKALQDEQNLRVGVYAMGGAGKTTLVKELGYRSEKEKLFEKVVFAVVSNPPNVRSIQENIASQLGLTFGNNQESDRARELWSRLTKGEKILIILDDVWEKLDLKAIGIPFEDRHKGCRVLLTTRRVDVCNSMECQAKIELLVLSEEDSWKMFQKYANIRNDPSMPLDVANEIARKCKGLPVAIATVASTLKGKEPREWEDALTTLKNVEPLIGVDENLIEVYNCLRLSYSNLKSKEVQELFLLCSFFPEDYEIPMEDLTRYAIGLNLFGDYRSSMKARRLALSKAKDTLINSCLLLNAKSYKGECVKMHDLIRELAHWIAKEEIQEISGSKNDEHGLDDARYLWFHETNGLPNQLNYPKLKILMISIETEDYNISFEEKEELFRGLDKLCVLILTRKIYFLLEISIKLPQSIQGLKSLRILHLQGWKLGNISSIESLKNLECLELSGCEIDELPCGMLELKYLKMLALSSCSILQNPFEVLGRFTQLEELYYYYFLDTDRLPWKIDGENISDFFRENCKLTNLTRYRIQIGFLSGELSNNLIPRGLSIDCFHPSTSNATIKDLVRRARHVCFLEIQGGYKNIVPDVVRAVGGKIQWIQLRLYSCDDIECLTDATTNVSSEDSSMLSALVELRVDSNANMKELCHGTPPSGFLQKLEKLYVGYCTELHSTLFVGNLHLGSLKVVKVAGCSKLTSLFTLSVALSLVLLEELEVHSCSGMKYLVADDNQWKQDYYNDHSISSASVFQKLKYVEIYNCESLEFIFPAFLAVRLVQLEEIRIENAAKLEHIFGQYQDEGNPNLHQIDDKEITLPSLQTIHLEEIPNFQSIFPMHCHPKDCPQVETTIGLEAITPMELHPSQNRATTWYSSAVQCLPKQLADLCHVRQHCSQADATAFGATTSKELYASQNTDIMLLSHVSTVPYCLSRQLLNMCHIRDMVLISLPTTVTSLFTLSAAQKMLVKNMRIIDCHGLKHILTNGEEVDFDHKSSVFIFPELRLLHIDRCNLLEFIFPACLAQCPPKLESLTIKMAPELKAVFGQCFHSNHLSHGQNENEIYMNLPALKEFYFKDCPLLPTKFIFDLTTCSDAKEPDCITTKEILRHDNMLNIETLSLRSFEIEGIFVMEGLVMNEHQDQLTSRLENLSLENLPELRYICMGPVECLHFQNLRFLDVRGCEKLTCILSVSVGKSLPQLRNLKIKNCNELEKIIEDDDEKDYSHNVWFPNLSCIEIKQCNKLRYLFFISSFNKFPKLLSLFIEEAFQLEEVFKWRTGETQDKDHTLLPELKTLKLRSLPCLTNVCEGFNLEAVQELEVEGCPKLPPEYRNNERKERLEEIIEEEVSTGHREDTYLPTILFPGSAKVNETQNQESIPKTESVESEEAKQEETEHEEGKKGEELVIEKPETSADNKKPHVTGIQTKAELGSAESNKIDQKESRDVISETSIDFSSGTSGEAPKGLCLPAAPQTFTTQAINVNEKIEESSSNPLEFPPPSNFSSGASGDAQEDSSTSASQYNATPIKEADGIVQKCPTPAKQAILGTSSTESELRRPFPSTMLGEIIVGQTETSVTSLLIASLSPIDYQNAAAPKEISASVSQHVGTPAEEYAAFRDIGAMKKRHIPLLEQAIAKHPSLWAWHEKYQRSQMKQFGYTALGDMLVFLTTTRWRDLTKEKKAQFESLTIELETFGFDLQWLRNTEAMIKQSNTEDEIINRIQTLKVKEMKQKIAVEVLEDCLQKAKRELEITASEVEDIKFKHGDLDDLIGF